MVTGNGNGFDLGLGNQFSGYPMVKRATLKADFKRALGFAQVFTNFVWLVLIGAGIATICL
jgi:hypothetical protein